MIKQNSFKEKEMAKKKGSIKPIAVPTKVPSMNKPFPKIKKGITKKGGC